MIDQLTYKIRRILNVILVILSVAVSSSPAVANLTSSFEGAFTSSVCCQMDLNENGEHEQEHEQNKGCRAGDCHAKGCHSQVPIFQYNLMGEDCQIDLISSTETQPKLNHFYLSFKYKDLIHSFWNPPKYIS